MKKSSHSVLLCMFLSSEGSTEAWQDSWSLTVILCTLYDLQTSLHPGRYNCIDLDNYIVSDKGIKSLIVLSKIVTTSVMPWALVSFLSAIPGELVPVKKHGHL